MNVSDMNISDLMTDLMQKGVQFQINEDKIKISSAQAVLTEDMLARLSEHKPEILSFLRLQNNETPTVTDGRSLSLDTIGRLISGFANPETSGDYRSPTVDVNTMAQKLAITFRPTAQNQTKAEIQAFSHELEETLQTLGVRVIPWQEATKEYRYDFKISILGWQTMFQKRMVKSDINAVVDLERKPSLLRKAGIVLAELFYFLYTFFGIRGQKISVSKIAMLTGWAENHAALQLEDPTNTQVIMLTEESQNWIKYLSKNLLRNCDWCLGFQSFNSQYESLRFYVSKIPNAGVCPQLINPKSICPNSSPIHQPI
jgi:TubC N-terminal docking domain